MTPLEAAEAELVAARKNEDAALARYTAAINNLMKVRRNVVK